MTLADEDTNSIRTDNANRAFQGNLATRVTQAGGQLWNQAMQVTLPFATNASGAIWWPNLQLMQVAPSGRQFCN